MHREATRDGGDDDDAYDEGAAMFAHQVATRSTSLGDPMVLSQGPAAGLEAVLRDAAELDRLHRRRLDVDVLSRFCHLVRHGRV